MAERVRFPALLLVAGLLVACATVTTKPRAAGSSDSANAVLSPAPLPPGSVDFGSLVTIPVDHSGTYAWTSSPVAGSTKSQIKSSGIGYKVVNGTVEFDQVPRGTLRDTPYGVVMDIAFSVTTFSGAPSVVIIRASGSTATP